MQIIFYDDDIIEHYDAIYESNWITIYDVKVGYVTIEPKTVRFFTDSNHPFLQQFFERGQ